MNAFAAWPIPVQVFVIHCLVNLAQTVLQEYIRSRQAARARDAMVNKLLLKLGANGFASEPPTPREGRGSI